MRREGSRMTLLQVVIVPGILLGGFLGVLAVLAAALTRRCLAVLSARRDQALVVSEGWQRRHKALRDQEHTQADVIASVITELESRKATYETFPQDVRDALYAAHESGRATERNAK
jgi:hypothetical protein